MLLQEAQRVASDLVSMNVPLGFGVGDDCYTRQLHLEKDRDAIEALGLRCTDYLRSAIGGHDSPHCFSDMLRPRRVPLDRSCILGIYSWSRAETPGTPSLAGVLYFLRPESDPGTWYIPLLLLEPGKRGQGIGSTVHAAFARWATARGARCLIVAVVAENVRARRFWRDRLGYAETESAVWRHPDAPPRQHPEYVHLLPPVVVRSPRMRLRVA